VRNLDDDDDDDNNNNNNNNNIPKIGLTSPTDISFHIPSSSFVILVPDSIVTKLHIFLSIYSFMLAAG
jgi:hypothetical protein